MNTPRTLAREVTATQIPSGEKTTLPAGTRLVVTQRLGGTYTCSTDFGLFRIEGRDGDALGEAIVDTAVKATPLANGAPDPEAIWNQLRQVYDPEIPVNIVDLGLVYSMDVSGDAQAGHSVDVAMTLTAPGCGMGPAIAEDAKSKILAVPGVTAAEVRITWEPPWNQSMISEEGKMKLGLL
ncbi:MAG: putative Fe-S cluster assembly protein SufT [Verrucomicrobia bacterium]|nr:putative Fe-S cluster assembly protein SufT [Verrucomicrobiota bacterium]